MEVSVFYVDTQKASRLEIADMNYVSDIRKERTMQYNQAADRARSYAVELALSFAVSGARLDPPVYSYDGNNKPLLEGQGEISLSHSGAIAVCALSKSPVGVDIERPRTLSENIGGRILCDEEKERFVGMDAAEKQYFLRSRWVIKESCLKLLGVGLAGSMKTLNVLPHSIMRGNETLAYYSTLDILGGDGQYLCAVTSFCCPFECTVIDVVHELETI